MDHTLFIYVISMDFHHLGDGLQLVRLVSLSYRIKVTTGAYERCVAARWSV